MGKKRWTPSAEARVVGTKRQFPKLEEVIFLLDLQSFSSVSNFLTPFLYLFLLLSLFSPFIFTHIYFPLGFGFVLARGWTRIPSDAYAGAMTQLLSYELALKVATTALLERSVCHPELFYRLAS